MLPGEVYGTLRPGPHGARPHGARPHGARPHGARPHGPARGYGAGWPHGRQATFVQCHAARGYVVTSESAKETGRTLTTLTTMNALVPGRVGQRGLSDWPEWA